MQPSGEAYGDSGGPVLDGSGKLVGLVSGNPDCGGSVALGVNLVEFGDWIEEQVC